MTPEEWARAKELFQQLRESTPDERERRLAQEPDPAIAKEAASLLRYDTESGAIDAAPSAVARLHESLMANHRLQAGDQVAGRFNVVRFAGEGGMGEVYEAIDGELGQRVALKVLKPQIAEDTALIRRFKKEIQNARAVAHPNVCRVYDFGREARSDGDLHFCTMEFVEGRPLSHWITECGPFTAEDILTVAAECAAALDAAHAVNVIHCDFKAGNVLASKPDGRIWQIRVTDFGLSRLWSASPGADPQDTATRNAALGTPAYMAPEQMRGEPPSPASDIYAFGVLLYAMAAGRTPYEGASPVALVAKKVSEPPEPLARELPRHWEHVIFRCLSREPKDRYATAGQAVAALRGRLSLPSIRMPRRDVLAAAAVPALALGAWWWWQSRRDDAAVPEWIMQGRLAMAENAPWRAAYLFEQAVRQLPENAVARSHLALAYAQLDRIDAAKDQLLALDQTPAGPRASLYVQAAKAVVLRQLDEAPKHFEALLPGAEGRERLCLELERAAALAATGGPEKALAVLDGLPQDTSAEPAILLQRGILLARKGQVPGALALLRQAEESFRHRNSPEGTAEALLQQATLLERGAKLTEAQASLDRSLALARSTGNYAQQLRLEAAQATLWVRAGKRTEAEELARQTLDLARRQGLENLAAGAQNDLGSVYLSLYRLEEAESHLRQAVTLAQAARARRQEAQSQLNLGSVLLRRGRMREALSRVDAGLPFYRQGGYQAQLTAATLLRGQALVNLGRVGEAESVFLEAAHLAGAGDRTRLLQAREWLADILAWKGSYGEALRMKWETLEAQRTLERPPAVVYLHLQRAQLLNELARPGEAAAELAVAAGLLEKLGKGGASIAEYAAIVEAQLALSQGHYAKPLPSLMRVRKAMETQGGLRSFQVTALLGELTTRSGNSSEGLPLCELAREQSAELEVVLVRVEVLGRLACAYAVARQGKAASEAATEAHRLAAEHGYRYWRLLSATILAVLTKLPKWLHERDQAAQAMGDDERGPVASRVRQRPDWRQLER